jgi:uncharacterized ion transporter superfamily protein YfcC
MRYYKIMTEYHFIIFFIICILLIFFSVLIEIIDNKNISKKHKNKMKKIRKETINIDEELKRNIEIRNNIKYVN